MLFVLDCFIFLVNGSRRRGGEKGREGAVVVALLWFPREGSRFGESERARARERERERATGGSEKTSDRASEEAVASGEKPKPVSLLLLLPLNLPSTPRSRRRTCPRRWSGGPLCRWTTTCPRKKKESERAKNEWKIDGRSSMLSFQRSLSRARVPPAPSVRSRREGRALFRLGLCGSLGTRKRGTRNGETNLPRCE